MEMLAAGTQPIAFTYDQNVVVVCEYLWPEDINHANQQPSINQYRPFQTDNDGIPNARIYSCPTSSGNDHSHANQSSVQAPMGTNSLPQGFENQFP